MAISEGQHQPFEKFLFRDLHPNVCMGTASDRYEGWIGQIYTKEKFEGKISRRPKMIAGKALSEGVLPIESVVEYFEHFPVVELDFTFYALLLDKNLESFAQNIYRLEDLGYTEIPLHYEEALIAYMSYTNKNIIPEGYTISQTTRNRLSDYAATIYNYGNNIDLAAREMYSKFGKTYWYYLKFINSQPQK